MLIGVGKVLLIRVTWVSFIGVIELLRVTSLVGIELSSVALIEVGSAVLT